MASVLITGGSRGIGAAAGELFAARGDRVTFLYEKNHTAAKAVAEETGATAICCDVADGEAVNRAFSQIGDVDILVCNAGTMYFGLLSQMAEDEWNRLFAVNVGGIYHCVNAAMPSFLKTHRGSIVTVASMWGQVGASCEAAYSATKGAVIALTKALAKELGPSGIRVNCVAPGGMVTPGAIFNNTTTAELYGPEWTRYVTEYGAGVPVAPNPDEIARMILTLCTPVSDFMYGQTVEVDGGSQFSFQTNPGATPWRAVCTHKAAKL